MNMLRAAGTGLLLLVCIAVPVAANAIEFRASDQPSVGGQERIDDDLYIAGGSVTTSGVLLKDLIAAGGTVLVDGEVRLDLLAAGGTVTVLGNVLDDARVAGGNVTIAGDIANDLVVAGGSVQLTGSVGGDALIAGGVVRIDAPIGGNVRVAAGDVYLNAPIGGNVEIEADNVSLGSNASIAGDLDYRSAIPASLDQGAEVRGETNYTPRVDVREGLKNGLIAFLSIWFVLKFFMLLGGAMAFGLLFPRYCTELTKRCLREPIPEFMTGLVTVIVLPVLSGILVATVIGMPLGFLGFLIFFAMLIYAHLIAPVILGSMLAVWLFKRTGEVSWKTILLGVVVFYIADFIPFVGWLARTFFALLALGAALRLKWGIAKDWR